MMLLLLLLLLCEQIVSLVRQVHKQDNIVKQAAAALHIHLNSDVTASTPQVMTSTAEVMTSTQNDFLRMIYKM